MYGIKYFFLNKNNQSIQGGSKKNFQGGTRVENIKSTIFQNPGGEHVPPLNIAGSASECEEKKGNKLRLNLLVVLNIYIYHPI
jgi:hypothetical protein